MKSEAEDVLALYRIKDAAKMTLQQKKNIAKWLKDAGISLIKDGDKYAPNFTGRYHR